jgi:hypothetical protein
VLACAPGIAAEAQALSREALSEMTWRPR